MFERLARYRSILVSGPQRSGTRIAAKMIAADTGHRYIDEDAYDTYDRQKFRKMVSCNQVVIHCPAMSHELHLHGDGIRLIVWMVRDPDEIVASERRVGWTVGPYKELARFGLNDRAAIGFRKWGGQVAHLKMARWWLLQRPMIKNFLELKFDSLAEHRLWVPKEKRGAFDGKQTK